MPNDSIPSLRWAVIGAGTIAKRFVGQLDSAEGAQLVAVGSSDPDRARAFVAQNAPQARPADHASVLADPEVDAVYIGTVHTSHAELTLAALAAGKHVLCEKPLAPNHGAVMAMVDAARTAGLQLVEAYMYRFHPQTRRVLDLVASGAVGDLTQIEASFSFRTGSTSGRLFESALAGGGILDVGGYPVSFARAVVGASLGRPFAEPTSLSGRGTIGETGVDEWAVADLTFDHGITAQVRSGVRVVDVNHAVVYGSRGLIRLSDPWTLNSRQELVVSTVDGEETITFEDSRPYALEAEALARAVASGEGPVEMSADDSLGNAKVLDQWRSAIDLRYPWEADDADLGTVSGSPLQLEADAPMPYGSVPGLDKRVSRLVMGCDNQPNLSHASALFDHFFSRGGTAFDTGYIYGHGLQERLLGRWITNRGIRDDVVVITKGAHTPHCDPDSITRQLLESLDRLGTDHTDIYLMHRDNPEIEVGEFVDVLDEHRRAGLISVFGGSNWAPERVDAANAYAAAHGKTGFTVLSNHFGLAEAYDVPWEGCRHVTDPASRAWLTERQIALFPWSSQARGFFTGRAHPDDHSDPELVRCYYSDDNFERLRRAEKLGADLGVPATAIALAYVLAQPFPTFPLFGPRSIAECRSSMTGLDVELSDDHVRWLDLQS